MEKRVRMVIEFWTDTYDEAQWAIDHIGRELQSRETQNWAGDVTVVSETVNDKEDWSNYMGDSGS